MRQGLPFRHFAHNTIQIGRKLQSLHHRQNLTAAQNSGRDVDAHIEMRMPLEERNHVAPDGHQNCSNKRFESVGSPLDLFYDRPGAGYRSILLDDSCEGLKACNRARVQIDDRLIIRGKLLGNFIGWRNSNRTPLIYQPESLS